MLICLMGSRVVFGVVFVFVLILGSGLVKNLVDLLRANLAMAHLVMALAGALSLVEDQP